MADWLKKLFGPAGHASDGPGAGAAVPASDSPPELEADLLETEAGARDLVDYLLSDRLFWQLSLETPLGTRQPKMTLGSLYEHIDELKGSSSDLGDHDRQRLSTVVTAWEAARRRYPTQVTAKLKRELDSYLKNWTYYLDQRRQDPERWKEEYDVEVRNRRRVELVLTLLGPDAPAGLLEDLQGLEGGGE